MMFCFRSILQIWSILIGFGDTNDFSNLGICKREFKFTCRSYCRFTLALLPFLTQSIISRIVAIYNNFTIGIRDLCLTSSLVLLCSGNCTVNIEPDRTDGILGFSNASTCLHLETYCGK